MPDVLVIGDGPGGLSAALFLAKNKLEVVVLGEDKTAMHWALLKNYLGVPEMLGSDFQKVARGQATAVGATLREAHVDAVARDGEKFKVTLAGGESLSAKYLILRRGQGAPAQQAARPPVR